MIRHWLWFNGMSKTWFWEDKRSPVSSSLSSPQSIFQKNYGNRKSIGRNLMSCRCYCALSCQVKLSKEDVYRSVSYLIIHVSCPRGFFNLLGLAMTWVLDVRWGFYNPFVVDWYSGVFKEKGVGKHEGGFYTLPQVCCDESFGKGFKIERQSVRWEWGKHNQKLVSFSPGRFFPIAYITNRSLGTTYLNSKRTESRHKGAR